MEKTGKTYWKCTVCGEIFEGAMPPQVCPVCGVGQEAFVEYVPDEVTFRDDKELKAVMIGSGVAAVSAAKAIRARNEKAKIEIYTQESILPYFRPTLTEALAKKIPDRKFYIDAPDFYKQKNIDVFLDSKVTAIDSEQHSLMLESGKQASYDKLLIATGSKCFVPPIPGTELPEVVTLREKSDLDVIKEKLAGDPKNIVVIGGGLLGLECGYYLSLRKHNITVLEACPAILPRQIDAEGGSVLKKVIESKQNVKVKLGVFVDEITGHDKVTGVRPRDGDVIPCDIVIVSAGVTPNKSLAEQAGIKTHKAIVVNEKMQTSSPDIYAAGDCAVIEQRYDGIWETALEQGRIAGANIAGDQATYEPKIFSATMRAFGTKLFSVGIIGTAEDENYKQVSRKNEITNTYRKLFFRKGILAGGVLLGDVSLTIPLLVGVTRGFNKEEAAENKLFD